MVAEKKETNDEFPRVVYQYKQGDYFGELALLHDISRQASVKAVHRCRVASIDRESFKTLDEDVSYFKNELRPRCVKGVEPVLFTDCQLQCWFVA